MRAGPSGDSDSSSAVTCLGVCRRGSTARLLRFFLGADETSIAAEIPCNPCVPPVAGRIRELGSRGGDDSMLNGLVRHLTNQQWAVRRA